jgi:hypothetical protein
MKRAIRDVLVSLFGDVSYSGRTRTWYANNTAYPVNLGTFYQLAKRITMYPSLYYIEHSR